jgi:hypothetical protein
MQLSRKHIGLAIATAAILGTLVLGHFSAPSGEEYRTFVSPDKRFKIVVYRTPQNISMPGQSSDAPGEICLYRVDNGKLLQKQSVEMVQLVEEVTWSTTNVYIKLVVEWDLPR